MCRSKAQGGRRCSEKGHSASGHTPGASTQAVPPARQGDNAVEAALADMREWRSRPVPTAIIGDMSPAKARLLGADTPEGRAYLERVTAYRTAGYHGQLDQDGNIPDPDDPRTREAAEIFAQLAGR